MNFDLTDIIVAAITLLVAVITTFLIPYLRTKVDADNWALLVKIVGVAVNAAEQLFVGSGRGDEKLIYVLDYIKKQGYDVEDETIRAIIEDAVFKIESAALEGVLIEGATENGNV